MKGLVLAAGLLLAGLWVWAAVLPVEPPPGSLPERYVGTFEFYAFETPPDSDIPSPLRRGQVQSFTFRADGTYLWRAVAIGGWELNRAEGSVRIDADGRLETLQHSLNRERATAEPARFDIGWERAEDGGETLVLTGVPEGQRLRLRPTAEEIAARGPLAPSSGR